MSKTSTLREWNWWGNPNNGIFKGYIQRSGLEHLIRCSYRNADKIVVSTFVERWHPETNTFHMPFGEMTITLDDVSSILGILVSGAAVAPLGDDNDTNFELLVKYLGVTDEETGTRVQIVYLRLLRNLDSVVGYSWGSGCLAWLYRQLGQASRSKVKQIAGYMTLLEAWVYEHMHGVVVPDHDLDYLEVQPRALRWIPRRDNGTTSVDVQKYRQRPAQTYRISWPAQTFHILTT
ncbi:PREDICTED: serine/threonine-protein phosphatase 7 long form homolog [Prunus mume]|uniref:Serine/threonine-protein phosphatase 7 long form homolog n=1 Tax=Prunus mume TaxID=102107 RepID=A0ABM0PT81_PRUMU|nr:PREDICTED: serine/threonine-protein phosphatase 7 long form homolog [Prunus mume]